MTPEKQNPAGGPGFATDQSGGIDETEHNTMPVVNLEEARAFLRLLDSTMEHQHFRTLSDDGKGRGKNYHGTLEDVAIDLQLDNGNGRGVFVVINDGGTKAADIKRIRACFADFDGPGEPGPNAPVPHMVVESSPGKHHYYFKIADLPVGDFKAIQKQIAAACGSDPTVIDPSRVMRLPGFLHQKGKPFRTRLIAVSDHPAYSPDDLKLAFGNLSPANMPAVLDDAKSATGFDFSPNADAGTVAKTERHEDLLKLAAQLARHVAFDGMGRTAALAAIKAEVERGRWTRDVGEDEFGRALDGAIDKCHSGEWKPPDSPVPRKGSPSSSLNRERMFRLLSEILANLPSNKWLIRKYLHTSCLAMIFGEPGTGKSFLAVEWAVCIAAGLPWQGFAVACGSVLYIAGEGAIGMARRFQACCQVKGIDPNSLQVFLRTVSASMTDGEGISEIQGIVARHVEEFGPPALIIVDTVARNFGPGDENSTKDMNRFVGACDALRECGACVCVVHHSGHIGKFRARGSSVLTAALDWAYSLQRNRDAQLKFQCRKAKESKFPKAFLLKITEFDLGFDDEDGEPVTSAVLQPVMAMAVDFEGKEGRGEHQVKAMELLAQGIAECRAWLDAESRESEAAYMLSNAWRDVCAANDIDRKRFSDVRKKFKDAGAIYMEGNKVFLGEHATCESE